jgi:CheY-like chemotaxis protein
MKVIIAEDDLVSRTVLEGLLKKSGYDVAGTYSDGRTALAAIAQNNEVHVAILDWQMPELTGIQICEELQKRGLKAEKHVILISNQSDKKCICEGLDAGADDYISKPYHDLELLARLKNAERHVNSFLTIKKYSQDLELLARRNNLLGELAAKSFGATTELEAGAKGTTPAHLPIGLSEPVANQKAAIQFEATLRSTLEGLGLSGLEMQIQDPLPKPSDQPGFVAWAPLYLPEPGVWLEILLEANQADAQAIVGEVLGEAKPSDQLILDLFSEFANVLRGSSRALCTPTPAVPFVPKTVSCNATGTYTQMGKRKRCIAIKKGTALMYAYLCESESPTVVQQAKTLEVNALTAAALLTKGTTDQILVPAWTVLTPKIIERIGNFVQSETADNAISMVTLSVLTKGIAPMTN